MLLLILVLLHREKRKGENETYLKDGERIYHSLFSFFMPFSKA